MKFRTFLLVACIVVVPLIAMFSHRIPPGTRAAVTAFLRERADSRRAAPAVAESPSDPVASSVPPSGSSQSPSDGALAEPASSVEQAAVAVPVNAPLPVTPVVVPVTAIAPEPAAFGPLRALGAVAMDCRPLAGIGGHVASCRLAVDGAGQLERVFQATGVDAATAAEHLLRDVVAWRRGGLGAGRPAAPATMRF